MIEKSTSQTAVMERLKQAISALKEKEPDLTNEGISQRLRYWKGYLSDILGGSKKISKLFLSRLRVEYSISGIWVLENKGEMFIDEEVKDDGKRYPGKRKMSREGKQQQLGVPVFDVPLASAVKDERITGSYVGIPQFEDCSFDIQASGDSMNPKIRNGDYILCKEVDIDEIIMGDAYVVLTHKGTQVIKYVHPHETKPDKVLLMSEDLSVPPTALARSAIHKIYKVRVVIKGY